MNYNLLSVRHSASGGASVRPPPGGRPALAHEVSRRRGLALAREAHGQWGRLGRGPALRVELAAVEDEAHLRGVGRGEDLRERGIEQRLGGAGGGRPDEAPARE